MALFGGFGYLTAIRSHMTWEDLLDEFTADRVVIVVDWWSDLDDAGKARSADGHFSVVEMVTQSTIRLWDPSIERVRELPREFFQARWYDWDYVDNKKRTERVDRVNAALIVAPPLGGEK